MTEEAWRCTEVWHCGDYEDATTRGANPVRIHTDA